MATTEQSGNGYTVQRMTVEGAADEIDAIVAAEAERLYGRGSEMALRVRAAWEASERGVAPEMVIGIDHANKPDFTGRTRMTVREDADGVRRWEALPPMTWNGVPVPFGRVDAVRAAAAPQPDPAPGQVWLPPPGDYTPGQLDADGTLTIAVADGDTLRFGGRQANARIGTKALRNGGGWTCIGVATPHGRVMVGDGFQTGAGYPVTISAVSPNPASVIVRWADGGEVCNRADAIVGWTRTRYAPARAGERYRHRAEGRTVQIWQPDRSPMLLREEDGWALYALPTGGRLDPAQWERLDACTVATNREAVTETLREMTYGIGPRYVLAPDGVADAETDVALRDRCITADWRRAAKAPGLDTATGAALDAIAARMGIERRAAVEPSGVATDALGRELAFDYGGNIKGPPSVDMTVDHPRCRSVLVGTVDPGATLTLTGPARDLRALADAVGRALESDGPHHAPFSGYIVRVQRDELLFSPTYSTGSGAPLAGDTRALAALRRCLLDAMASDDGRATLAQWGAKGPRVEVRRDGRRHRRTLPPEASPAPRYSPDVGGGADAWRWGGDDR